jgi:serine/threonine protein kinase
VFIAYLGEADPELKKQLPQAFACKKIRLQYEDEYEEMKQREVRLSKCVKSSHNIYLYCAVKIENHVYFFFHFYNGGMLSDVVDNAEIIPEKLCAQMLHQILIGLMELHENKFVHRDLKPDNIMFHFPCMVVDKSVPAEFYETWNHNVHNCYSLVIADLGMGREEGLRMTEGAGTPLYRAPECEKGYYNNKADILSLGIICFELLFGEPIFTQAKAKNLVGKLFIFNT